MAERFENGYGGLVAVVTGGGTGMGRELVRQLTAQGCDVATCDVIPENLAATVDLCTTDGNTGQIFTHIADVSIEAEVLAFRDAVAKWRPHVHVLFNNAGIGGGGSFVLDERAGWAIGLFEKIVERNRASNSFVGAGVQQPSAYTGWRR